MAAMRVWFSHICTLPRRLSLRIPLLVFFIQSIVVLLTAIIAEPFFRNAIYRAVHTTIYTPFSTSTGAILRDIAVVVFVVIRILRREGPTAVQEYIRKGKDAALAVVAAFVLTFLYHLFFTIPNEINVEAASQRVPMVHIPPPPDWDQSAPVRVERPTLAEIQRAIEKIKKIAAQPNAEQMAESELREAKHVR